MKESYIHVSIRRYLKNNGWTLVAGEYPGGTDDELYVFSIMNPEVARDNSPDHRRHSEGEIVPDLIAYKNGVILVIEAKPKYSNSDKNKLVDLLENKFEIFLNALSKFCMERKLLENVDLNTIEYVPALAFEKTKKDHKEHIKIAHIYVENYDKVEMVFYGGGRG